MSTAVETRVKEINQAIGRIVQAATDEHRKPTTWEHKLIGKLRAERRVLAAEQIAESEAKRIADLSKPRRPAAPVMLSARSESTLPASMRRGARTGD